MPKKQNDIDVNFYGSLLLTPAVSLESSLMVLFNDSFVTLHGCQICLCTKLVSFFKALHHEDVNTINLKLK